MLESPSSAVIPYPSIAMARFGKTAEEFGGVNRYRVIWAPSRKVILLGQDRTMTVHMYGDGPHADVNVGQVLSVEHLNFRLTPDHKNGEVWILEVWKAPWDLYHGTRAQWNADPKMLNTGPYPAKGDYVFSEVIPGTPSLESVEKMILLVEDGWQRKRPIDNALAIRANSEKRVKDRKTTIRDMINNRSLIGAGETYSSRGGGRGTKTINLSRTANELGLPTGSGATGVMKTRRRSVYQVPNTRGL